MDFQTALGDGRPPRGMSDYQWRKEKQMFWWHFFAMIFILIILGVTVATLVLAIIEQSK